MPKRREETPSEDEASLNDSAQLSGDNEGAAAAQWVDEDDLDGMIDSEEDEFAEDRDDEFEGGPGSWVQCLSWSDIRGWRR